MCVPVTVLDAPNRYLIVGARDNLWSSARSLKGFDPFSFGSYQTTQRGLSSSFRDAYIIVQIVLSQFAIFQEIDDTGNELCVLIRRVLKILFLSLPRWKANLYG